MADVTELHYIAMEVRFGANRSMGFVNVCHAFASFICHCGQGMRGRSLELVVSAFSWLSPVNAVRGTDARRRTHCADIACGQCFRDEHMRSRACRRELAAETPDMRHGADRRVHVNRRRDWDAECRTRGHPRRGSSANHIQATDDAVAEKRVDDARASRPALPCDDARASRPALPCDDARASRASRSTAKMSPRARQHSPATRRRLRCEPSVHNLQSPM